MNREELHRSIRERVPSLTPSQREQVCDAVLAAITAATAELQAKKDIPCPTCNGTGGPPAQHLIAGAADWWGETMEGDVLRGMLTKGTPNGK